MALNTFYSQHKHSIKSVSIFLIAFTLLIGSLILLWISSFKVPSLQTIEERRIRESTKIYDSTGNILLYDISQNIKRTVIPLEQISPFIQKATIAIEDKDFYKHQGILGYLLLLCFLTNFVKIGRSFL